MIDLDVASVEPFPGQPTTTALCLVQSGKLNRRRSISPDQSTGDAPEKPTPLIFPDVPPDAFAVLITPLLVFSARGNWIAGSQSRHALAFGTQMFFA
jgi:hypothetical protein